MSIDHEPALSGVKTCTHCHETKPVIAFAVNKRSSDGLDPWCRQCDSVQSKKRAIAKKFEQRRKPSIRTVRDELDYD